MITLQELCRYLQSYLMPTPLNDYCPNGLQVEGRKEVSKIAVAVSASYQTIEAAKKEKADALIVHHGMIWNREPMLIVGNRKEKLKVLLENQMSLLAYHLPLDIHQEVGNNWKAARDMGWQNLKPFGLYNGMPIGVQGTVKPQHREEFRKQLEKYYQHDAHCALGGNEKVQTVALISGGAHKSISEAAEQKIDCFVTGSFDEPIWNIAFEDQVNFFALGHSATEKVGPKALGDHLHQTFQIPVSFIDVPNPF